MVFQDPLSALNPVHRSAPRSPRCYRVHRGSRRRPRARAAELLDQVRHPGRGEAAGRYPHEFSGGMRQRVMIAMALACDPDC